MRRKYILAVTLAVLTAALLSLSAWNHIQEKTAMNSAFASSQLQSSAKQIASNLSDFAGGTLLSLESASAYINETPETSDLTRLKQTAQTLELTDIVVCKGGGSGVDLNGAPQSVGFCPYYGKALEGTASVAVTNFYEKDASPSVVYSVPITQNGKTVGVLRAKQDVSLLRKALQVTTFGGKEQVYLLRGNGQIVLSADEALPEEKNFVSMLQADADSLNNLSQMIKQGRSVLLNEIQMQNKPCSLDYEGVRDFDDWGVVVSVSAGTLHALFDQKSNFVDTALPVLSVIEALCVLALLYLVLHELNKNARAEKLAYRDPVTGCLTIVGFRKEFAASLQKRGNDNRAMIQLGVDKYDSIQDFFGTQETNRLLSAIADTLRQVMKSDDIFCKANMKYFYLLIRYQNSDELSDFINFLDSRLLQCNSEAGKNIKYSLSFHYGVYPLAAEDKDVNLVMERANKAFVKIKDNASQKFGYYGTEDQKQIISHNEVLNEMQRALDNKEFVVYYQPTFDLSTGGQAACEALVRWMHPEKGLIYPAQFIGALEQNGLVVQLDRYTMDTVCSWLKVFMSKGYRPLPVSVNISRLNLYDSDFEQNAIATVEKYGVPPSLIKLEIAEEVFSEHGDVAAKVLRRMKDYGFLISMDNFGTGTTSMNTFYRVPLDELKIDRKFLLGAGKSSKGAETIHGIIAMTKSLSIKVVADGVDNKEQAQMLRGLGCAMLQGYVFCEPLPVREFENYAYGPRAKNNRIDV